MGLIMMILAYIFIGVVFLIACGIIGLILTAIGFAIYALFYGAAVVIAVFIFFMFIYYLMQLFTQ